MARSSIMLPVGSTNDRWLAIIFFITCCFDRRIRFCKKGDLLMLNFSMMSELSLNLKLSVLSIEASLSA